MTFWVLFVIVVYYNLDIDQIHMKTAYSYSFIDQLIYVKMSKGIEISVTWDLVCKLHKVIYKLKYLLRL